MTQTPVAADAKILPPPLVSVVIPCYNRREKLLRAVDSVLNQSEDRIEVIVVDDGSTEDISVIRRSRQDPRLTLLRLETNGGAARARNHGIAIARGQYLALLDSDDFWLPQKLEAQLKIARDQPSSGPEWIIYNRIIVRTAYGEVRNPLRKFETGHDDLAYYLVVERNYMQTSGLLGPLELFRQYPFDETLKRHQDFDLILRMGAGNVRLLYCGDENVIYDDTELDDRLGKLYRPEPTLDWMRKSSLLSNRVRSELYVHYVGLNMLRTIRLSGAYYVCLGILLYPYKLWQLCSKVPSKLLS